MPLRATVSSFGPILLSKVLGLNETQESTLGLVFHYCDTQGLPLLDLEDLRAVLGFLTCPEGKAELKSSAGLHRHGWGDPAEPGHLLPTRERTRSSARPSSTPAT